MGESCEWRADPTISPLLPRSHRWWSEHRKEATRTWPRVDRCVGLGDVVRGCCGDWSWANPGGTRGLVQTGLQKAGGTRGLVETGLRKSQVGRTIGGDWSWANPGGTVGVVETGLHKSRVGREIGEDQSWPNLRGTRDRRRLVLAKARWDGRSAETGLREGYVGRRIGGDQSWPSPCREGLSWTHALMAGRVWEAIV
jgi:hypothetical protein